MSDLNAKLLDAHARGDKHALVGIYTQAADEANDTDAMCFHLTHAYIFALDCAHASADTLRARLVAAGREE